MTASAPAALRRPLVLSDLLPRHVAVDLALVAAGAGVVGIFAQISFVIASITSVPFTGQTFAVLLVAGALGLQRAVASMALYLAVGFAGVPWFQGGSHGATATFGYVIGFIAAAALVGWLASRGWDRTPARTFLAMTAGTFVIYAFGVPYLAAATAMDFGTALHKGMVVFWLTDLVKVALAAGLFPAAWSLVDYLKRDKPAGGRGDA